MTTVNVTRVTNVYNTVVINHNVNNVAYANRNVNGGVTVVSHDTFVNARPVARNVMPVPARELASAPVSHLVGVEPVRSSVLGAGRAVAKIPPAAVTSRPVVALRTPAPMPRSFEQRQAQAGGHLSQPPLVRQEAPGRPVPAQVTVTRPGQAFDGDGAGYRPIGQAAAGSSLAKPQPRVWEAQGTPEPEKSTPDQPENRNAQPAGVSHPQQQAAEKQPAQQWSHPLAKPAPPVQERNPEQERQQEQKFNSWQQQRPASPPPPRQQSSPPPPRQEAPSKK